MTLLAATTQMNDITSSSWFYPAIFIGLIVLQMVDNLIVGVVLTQIGKVCKGNVFLTFHFT